MTRTIILVGLFLLCFSIFAAAEIPNAIGIWTFDGGEIGEDLSENGNHGELVGDVQSVEGVFGKGIELDGASSCIEVPDSDTLDVADDQLTMMCWFWWEGSGDGWQTFVSKGPMSGTNENWALFINTGGGYSHFIITPGGGRTNVDSPGGMFGSEEWHFIAGTYDGSMVRTYFDGELVKEQGVSGDLTPNESTLRIGHREASSHWWKGKLDEVAVFNRALDEDEINMIMEKGLVASMAVEPADKLSATWGSIRK